MKLSTPNEIQIFSGKTLKLHHVLIRGNTVQNTDDIQKMTHMFEAYTKSRQLTLYGPPIIHITSQFHNGIVSQHIELMGQLREIPDKVLPPYTFSELIRIENCIVAHYHGDLAKLSIAYNKIEIHCFENALTLKGETYTIIVNENENIVTADIFAEVIV